MPIRREHRFFYPIDWRELSSVIRFDQGCREAVKQAQNLMPQQQGR